MCLLALNKQRETEAQQVEQLAKQEEELRQQAQELTSREHDILFLRSELQAQATMIHNLEMTNELQMKQLAEHAQQLAKQAEQLAKQAEQLATQEEQLAEQQREILSLTASAEEKEELQNSQRHQLFERLQTCKERATVLEKQLLSLHQKQERAKTESYKQGVSDGIVQATTITQQDSKKTIDLPQQLDAKSISEFIMDAL